MADRVCRRPPISLIPSTLAFLSGVAWYYLLDRCSSPLLCSGAHDQLVQGYAVSSGRGWATFPTREVSPSHELISSSLVCRAHTGVYTWNDCESLSNL